MRWGTFFRVNTRYVCSGVSVRLPNDNTDVVEGFVGENVGDDVVGLRVGSPGVIGVLVGCTVGEIVGTFVGAAVGEVVGNGVGDTVGLTVVS